MELKRDRLLQGGRYRIVDSIGRGGFGITYLAEQVMAKRKVCIKEFFPKDYYKRESDTGSLTLSSEGFGEAMNKFKAKFIKEAQTIAALDHPNIIHIHDVFEENGTAYYVMDYIEGESLSDIVKRGGAMSERDAMAYIKQVAAALEHIHEQKIMHLDVKPGNIMVRTKGDHAILIDFGLSKHYDAKSGDATSTTPVGVSHGYAPMEQYQDGGVSTFSPETDIYSLGATLYYLVTGNVPPQATAVAEQGLPQLGALSSNIREAIERSMSYLRKDRPHTIKEFLALLDNDEPIVAVIVADDEKTNIAPQPPTQKQDDKNPKPKKSDWWVWTLLLLFIVVLLMSIKDLFSNGDNSKEVATKEKTVYMPTNDTTTPTEESESLDAEEVHQDAAPEEAPVGAPLCKFVPDAAPVEAPEAAPVQEQEEAPKKDTEDNPIIAEMPEVSENNATYKVSEQKKQEWYAKAAQHYKERMNNSHKEPTTYEETMLELEKKQKNDRLKRIEEELESYSELVSKEAESTAPVFGLR